jgi:hypothetical protein
MLKIVLEGDSSPLTKLKDEIRRIIINVEIHILFPNDLKFRRISQRRRKRTQSKTKVSYKIVRHRTWKVD